MAKSITNAEPLWNKIERKQELQEVVIATLIKNGEICGTEILAENLLKLELGERALETSMIKKECLSPLTIP